MAAEKPYKCGCDVQQRLEWLEQQLAHVLIELLKLRDGEGE